MNPASMKTSYSKEDILHFCVARNDTKRRLPSPPLLMFDRITEIQPEGGRFERGFLLAEKDMRVDEWFYFCHFQGDPVMPGILQVDAMLQLAGFHLSHLGFEGYGRALRVGRIVFREQVRPHHKKVSYRLDFRKIVEKPTPVAIAEASCLVDGQISAEVEDMMVGIFADLHYDYP